MPAASQVNLDAISEADFSREPYTYFLGSNFLKPESIPALRADFPELKKPGFLLASDIDLRGKFADLIDELEGPEVTEAISKKVGVDLHPFPRLTTIRKVSQLKDGDIHTDGTDKVLTMLVYMNDEWQDDGAGRLRVLYGPGSFDEYKAEVPPTMGTVFGFLRADNSWHGHKPFAGERRVVQIAWVKSQEAVERKKRRNRVATVLKGIFGR